MTATTREADYRFELVNGWHYHPVLELLYRRHYGEMQARLKKDGIPISPYNPRLDEYKKAIDAGYLLTYIVRFKETVVGYSNIWLTSDMHNGDFIAREDTVYVLPEHRNGTGKRLVKFILADLKERGVKRVMITPVTDLRVGIIWQRMGFKPAAQVLIYTFEGN